MKTATPILTSLCSEPILRRHVRNSEVSPHYSPIFAPRTQNSEVPHSYFGAPSRYCGVTAEIAKFHLTIPRFPPREFKIVKSHILIPALRADIAAARPNSEVSPIPLLPISAPRTQHSEVSHPYSVAPSRSCGCEANRVCAASLSLSPTPLWQPAVYVLFCDFLHSYVLPAPTNRYGKSVFMTDCSNDRL